MHITMALVCLLNCTTTLRLSQTSRGDAGSPCTCKGVCCPLTPSTGMRNARSSASLQAHPKHACDCACKHSRQLDAETSAHHET